MGSLCASGFGPHLSLHRRRRHDFLRPAVRPGRLLTSRTPAGSVPTIHRPPAPDDIRRAAKPSKNAQLAATGGRQDQVRHAAECERLRNALGT